MLCFYVLLHGIKPPSDGGKIMKRFVIIVLGLFLCACTQIQMKTATNNADKKYDYRYRYFYAEDFPLTEKLSTEEMTRYFFPLGSLNRAMDQFAAEGFELESVRKLRSTNLYRFTFKRPEGYQGYYRVVYIVGEQKRLYSRGI